jgi:hypothetical protein
MSGNINMINRDIYNKDINHNKNISHNKFLQNNHSKFITHKTNTITNEILHKSKLFKKPLEETLKKPLEETLKKPLEETLKKPLEETLKKPLEETTKKVINEDDDDMLNLNKIFEEEDNNNDNKTIDSMMLLINAGKKMGNIVYNNKFNYKKRIVDIDNKMYDKNHYKKMLCFNMLNHCNCPYLNKCVYAHTLGEQIIDSTRKKAFDIIDKIRDINNKIKIEEINLIQDKNLMNIFLQLTKLCMSCHNGTCPGGYNCKYGAFCKKYHVCYDDLMYGNCKDGDNCSCVHLSDGGILPISIQKSVNFTSNKTFKNNINSSLSDENYYNLKTRNIKINIEDENEEDEEDEEYIMNALKSPKEYKIVEIDSVSSMSEENDNIDNIIDY